MAVRFVDGYWSYLGEAREHFVSEARREVVSVLEKSSEPLPPKDIAARLGKRDSGSVRRLLAKMVMDDLIEDVGGSKYRVVNMRKIE